MNSILILLLLLIIMLFLSNNTNNSKNMEGFVQVKGNSNPNKNAPLIKPIQVSSNYIPPNNLSQRDDWISNPKNSPNIAPLLINPSDDLPGTSVSNFENSNNKLNINTNNAQKSSLMSVLNKSRPNSGQLIKPIELDYSPSSNSQPDKPYLTQNTPQANSEYLDYADVSMQKLNAVQLNNLSKKYTSYEQSQEIEKRNKTNSFRKSQNDSDSIQETETETETEVNLKIKTSNMVEQKSMLSNTNIAKKLIKKAAELSVFSTNGDDTVQSVQKANYAIGYLDALQDIMTDSEIKNLVDIDLDKFTRELKKIQNHNITTMQLKCPSLSSDNKYLLDIVNKL